MSSDIVMNKSETVLRCVRRILEEYRNDPENLHNETKQDSIILNLQRACEACIDLAMHVVSQRKLGLPQSSRDAFEILQSSKLIDGEVSRRMKAMVGFRNVAVHDYQSIQLPILQSILEHHLGDFETFAAAMRKLV